tara:strand:- start:1594 stop:3846 length:2253 start_codon:yes stop_codon:yes gene_type:complete
MTYNNRSVPRQAIPESKKTLEWCKDNLRAITKTLGTGGKHNDSKNKDIANYNMYNGFVNSQDYEYITEQYGVPYPAQMNNFPLTSTKIDLLVNEDTERPLDKKVSSINSDAALRKEKFKVSLIADKLLEDINSQFKDQFNVDAPSENEGFPIPEDIDTFMRYEYKELIEEVCQDGLDYLVNKYRLKDAFRDGFRDFLVTGKEFYKVYVKNGDPFARRVDPRALIWDMSIQNDYLEDSQWVGEERWMTINEILDDYREELSTEDVHELEDMSKLNDMEGVAAYNESFDWLQYDKNKGIKVRVVSAEWKSVKQIKYKVSENKHNPSEPFKKVVGEDYKARKKEKVQNVYIDDIWEATEIGGKIYVQCRRRPNQVRSVDDVGTTALSYVGCVHNYSTGNSKSLVDLLRHVQMMYNIVHYHIELTLARSGGKAVVYDVSQMPTDMGMDMQSVMYHLKTDGIIPINSMQEGQEASKFNQFQQVDFTLSQSVQQLINLKLMLEQTAGYISGVSPQREGAVGQYEYVGNVQRSVVQSSLSTKGWFFQHGEVKKMVFSRLCNLMKVAWSDGKKAGYVLGDGGYKFLNVLPDIALNDYGVFLGDSGKDDSMRQVVQQMSQAALQQGSLTMLDAIKVLKSESLAEAENVLEKGLATMKKMAEQQNVAAQEQQQALSQQQQEQSKAESEMKQAELQTKIKVAEINAKSSIDVAEIQSDTRLQAEDTKEKNKLVLEGVRADLQEQMKENESKRAIPSKLNNQ